MLVMPSILRFASLTSTIAPCISDSDILSARNASSTAVMTGVRSGAEPVRALISLTSPPVPRSGQLLTGALKIAQEPFVQAKEMPALSLSLVLGIG